MKVDGVLPAACLGIAKLADCKSANFRLMCSVKLENGRLRNEIFHAGPSGILVIRNRETRPDTGARYSPA